MIKTVRPQAPSEVWNWFSHLRDWRRDSHSARGLLPGVDVPATQVAGYIKIFLLKKLFSDASGENVTSAGLPTSWGPGRRVGPGLVAAGR